MDIAIIGGDLRNAFLAQLLGALGLDARTLGMERIDLPGIRHIGTEDLHEAKYLLLNAPLRATAGGKPLDLDTVLERASKKAKLIFAGPRPAPDLAGYRLWDLTRDESFLRKNAELTAEGAIRAAMDSLPDSISDASCLVIGWGRIGRPLAEKLAALGAEVTVASRSATHRHQALARGLRAVAPEAMGEALGQANLVFSTPPALVLDEARLRFARENARVIDLAGAPYGVDLGAAEKLGLRAWREPGLPGRYCPRSAARVLADAVVGILKAEGVDHHA